MCLIFLLNRKSIIRIPRKAWLIFTGWVAFYLMFNLIKGSTITYYQIAAWLSAFFILGNYINGKHSFVDDLFVLTRFCVIYSLLHIPVMLLFKPFIFQTSFDMYPKTFIYLFWFNGGSGVMGMPRIQGFCWEPSCWNLLLNLNLVITLMKRYPIKEVGLNILAIISVMATTGIVTMFVILVLYYIVFNKQRRIKGLVLGGIVSAILFPFVYGELTDKLSTGSGNARMGDIAIAAAIMKTHPIMGADLDNITTNMQAMKARMNAWTVEGDYTGYMEQGMVNAFASMFVEWGIFSFVLLFLMFRSPLFGYNSRLRFLYMTCFCLVLMGTPITRTGFFYMLPFSTLLISPTYKRGKQY